MPIPLDTEFVVEGVKATRGQRVVSLKEAIRERKRRNRSPKSAEELRHCLAVHERFMAVSTEIRRRHALPPLDEGQTITGWRSKLAEAEAKEAAKPKRKAAAKSEAVLTPAELLRAAAKRRRELETEREKLNADIADLVARAQKREGGLTVTGVADALGLSRQRLYQLAGEAG